MMLLSVTGFIGRFHPALVHFPVGILLLAALFRALTSGGRRPGLEPAIPLMLFWGMLTAIASCISGFFLSQTADYDSALLQRHQWMGIGTAALTTLLYIMHKRNVQRRVAVWTTMVMAGMVGITGHLGGSLTHGEDYLTEGLGAPVESGPALAPIPAIQEAKVYNDIVQPLLEARCYSCHGPNKQKGKLRLDKPEFMLKGGEDGKIFEAGKAEESEMIKRLLLPTDAKKHMPPKEKSQLTKEEIALLHWWVSTGADFDRRVKELQKSSEMENVFLALQTGTTADTAAKVSDIPVGQVKPASPAALEKLKKAGVMVLPVSQESNYLSANFITAESTSDSVIALLEPVKEQLAWLKLDGAILSEAAYGRLAQCRSITRLQLSNSNISDQHLQALRKLEQLQSLNLVNTQVTAAGIRQLAGLPNLRYLYLYRTRVITADWKSLQSAFPATRLDSGNYLLPLLPGDTSLVKLPQ